MNKDYQKPEVEFVSLVVQEDITTDKLTLENADNYLDGEMGVSDSIF